MHNPTPPLMQRQAVRCNLCGADNARPYMQVDTATHQPARMWRAGVPYDVGGIETIAQCRVCGLIYVSPRLEPSAGLMPYSVEEERAYFAQTRAGRLRAYRRVVAHLPRWLGHPATSLLDIGCGDGVLLEVAQQAGIASHGYEISPELIALVRERLGTETIRDRLDQVPRGSYDVVTLMNVIEHVPDPTMLLYTASRLLRPGGVLLVHTPNIHGIPARLKGAAWHQIEPLAHLYYFAPPTLAAMLTKVGLRVTGRFNLVVARGGRALVQQILGRLGVYVDNGLGMVAHRADEWR